MENKQIIEMYNLIEKEIMPFGFYYNCKSNIISSNLNIENDKQMRNFIEIKIKSNNENFINDLKTKNEIDFIKKLNIHYSFYNKKTSVMTPWLSNTERLIKKNINDIDLSYAFDNWLKEIQSLSQPQSQKSLPIINENLQGEKPKNPYPKIFKNGYAWKMFEELKKLTVDKNPLADYSFIYYKMIDKKLSAIDKAVTHPIFIEFLNNNCGTDISAKKLTYKDQLNKHKLYQTTLDKFQADILGNP